MRARDQLGVADVLECALEGTADAHLRQARGHVVRALLTAASRARQSLAQRGVVGIEAQAEDVHGLAGKGDRNLGAGQVGHAQRVGGDACAVLAPDFVVVGQRPQLHAVGRGARGDRLGLQRAVGDGRVAVQVGVGQMVQFMARHAMIVPFWRSTGRVCAGASQVLACV